MIIRPLLIAAVLATPAFAKPSLWNYERISQGLFDIGVAHGIRKNCDNISANKFRGATFAWSLVNYAKSQGYTQAEVRAFIDDDAEKAKLRKRVEADMAAKGLDYKTPNGLCDFGRAEINKGSQVGKLLRVN